MDTKVNITDNNRQKLLLLGIIFITILFSLMFLNMDYKHIEKYKKGMYTVRSPSEEPQNIIILNY